ncbi:MFS transporter [Schumannella luteola]|uniref:EmrB/QacA subfamily drug resistance transporter n=1 Tax=Schumannella luteola TaxID=472059 RepID=A0A852Y845_9MICO|nr:MFS transporter [Schumannella luteola]NYG97401.1 EmrB/QacA subfamily drug resistance transporter [Schumannella luteola]TPX01647.1 MFS transporter [Schumannella luteola]
MTQTPTQDIPLAAADGGGADGGAGASARQRHPGAILAVLAFAGLGASFMQTILIPIQGELPRLLNTTSDNTAWVITATLVAAAVCTPVAGRLGDMFGKRRVAMALLLLQAIGAIVAALSNDVGTMIVARVLQGMAAGVIPLGISILRDVLPPRKLGSGIALVSATLGVGGALGLPLSAVVAENLDWHALFWVAAGIALLAFAAYAAFVPASAQRTPGRIDVVGIIGLALGLVGVLIAVSRGGEWGWGDARTLTLLIGGVVVLLIWGVIELRVKDPLVDLRVSVRGPVLLTNLASVAMGFALFASNVVLPQLLELPRATGIGLGLTLTVAALILAPSGLAMMAMSPVAGRVERRWGPKPLLIVGAAVLALAYGLALLFHAEAWQILLVNIVLGVGVGMGYAAMPALIMQAVPAHETGAANGLNALMRSLGTSIASAVAGAILAQSVTTVGGVTGPSEGGFLLTLVLGLGAAVVCVIVAAFIPRPRADQKGSIELG